VHERKITEYYPQVAPSSLRTRCTSQDDIEAIDKPERAGEAPVMTEKVEDILRRTMTHHHLSKRKRGLSVISIGSDTEPVVPDGRIKYLRKGPKQFWRTSAEGEWRDWDGVRLDGETYWVS
jgi:hypothetical protein